MIWKSHSSIMARIQNNNFHTEKKKHIGKFQNVNVFKNKFFLNFIYLFLKLVPYRIFDINFQKIKFRKIRYGTDRLYFSGKLRTPILTKSYVHNTLTPSPPASVTHSPPPSPPPQYSEEFIVPMITWGSTLLYQCYQEVKPDRTLSPAGTACYPTGECRTASCEHLMVGDKRKCTS